MAVGELDEPRQERVRRHHAEPPRPRTGSTSTAPTSPPRSAPLDHVERAIEVGLDARVGREPHVRAELLGERRAVALAQATRRQRPVAEPVVRALERDDPGRPVASIAVLSAAVTASLPLCASSTCAPGAPWSWLSRSSSATFASDA